MQEGTLIQNAPIESKQSPMLSSILGKIVDGCIMGLALLIPVWFLSVTLDILELNKQTLLVMLTMVALIAWVAKSLLDRSISLSRSWLHLVVLFYLIGYLVTSWFSLDRYISFVGNIGQMQWAFTTIAAFAVLYFITVNRIKTTGRVYDVILWFLLGSSIAGLYGLLQIFGIFIFGAGGMTGVKNFNTIGTVNALGVFMVIPTIIATALAVLGCTEKGCYLDAKNRVSLVWKIVTYVTLALGLISAILINFWVVWASLIFGMLTLVVIRFIHQGKACKPISLALPVTVIIVAALFLVFQRSPLFQLQIPAEVSPSGSHTWQIAQQVLRDAPLFGSGPGTWLYDYAKYRSVGVNISQFWTIRFERGLTAFLTMIAMLGLVGTTLWLLLVISGVTKSAMHLIRKKDCEEWLAYLTVFSGWITSVFIAFLYNYNVSHHYAFWLLLSLLGVLVAQGQYTWDQRTKPWVMGLLSVVLILLGVGAISATWLMGQRLVADGQYSSAVAAFQKGQDIDVSIGHLNTAVALNPMNDVYYRNLSQAYLVKVSRMMQAEPTEETVKQVNNNVSQAVEIARKATASTPSNVDNWSNLAIVYQAIASFTRGADEFAISSYQEALTREPNNPVFMNEIGKLYVLRSDAYRTLLNSPEAAAKKQAEEDVRAQLEKAAEWFNKAIATKPDYAAAHFNLGLVYERQGRLEDSIRKFEEVYGSNTSDLGVAFQLAILYYRNGNKDNSMNQFKQIVDLEPRYSNARWFLSSIYEERGMLDEAIQQVEAVKELNPDNKDVVARLDALKQKKAGTAVAPATGELPQPLDQNITSPGQGQITP